MQQQVTLSEIPEAMFRLINGTREVQLFTKHGEIKSINTMRGIYRVYIIDRINGSGEYRFTPEEAAEITISIL
jgi:hypothetical protein